MSLAIAASALAACGTTHLIRPVGRGNTRVSLSAGGPFATVGSATIPVPMTTLGVAHGVTDAVDVHADIHPFGWLFSPGNGSISPLGATMGLAVHPIPMGRKWLTIGADLYGFTNRLDAELFTNLWVAGAFDVTRWFTFGGGLHNTVMLGSSDPYQNNRSRYTPTIFLQAAVHPSRRVSIDLEARWYALADNSVRVVPNYIGIGGLGALGILIGVHYQFGGER